MCEVMKKEKWTRNLGSDLNTECQPRSGSLTYQCALMEPGVGLDDPHGSFQLGIFYE